MDSELQRDAVEEPATNFLAFLPEEAVFGKWTNVLAVVGALWLGCRLLFQVLPYMFQAVQMNIFSRMSGPYVDLRQKGTWAVVTGSTDGIGKAFVEHLAAMGLNVVLISRNPQKLADQAQEIRENFGVETRTITVDFTRQDIYDKLAIELNGLDIGTLVNNVGMTRETPDFYDEMENKMKYIPDLINCNICSVAMMNAIVLPRMVEKKRGVIINVSSAAGYRPVPMFALYSSSKGFVNYLSEALSHEYWDRGILVQTLTPYVVSTRMSKMQDTFMTPSPSTYVMHALRSLGVRSPTCGYWFHDLQHLVASTTPLHVVKMFFIGFMKAEKKRNQKRSALMA